MSTFPTSARPQAFSDAADGPGLERMPPCDVDIEKALLSACIVFPDVVGSVIAILPDPDAFYKEEHQIIYRVILDMMEKSEPISGLNIFAKMRTLSLLEAIGGRPYYEEIIGASPGDAMAEYHAGVVREKWMFRRGIVVATDALRDLYGQQDNASAVLGRLTQRIYDIDAPLGGRGPVRAGSAEAAENPEPPILSGFVRLDAKIRGLRAGHQIVLGARPSVGKSAFAANIIRNVAVLHGVPAALFTLEMSKREVEERLISSIAWVSSDRIERNALDDAQREQVEDARTRLAGAPLWIDHDPGLTMVALMSRCRRLKQQFGLKLAVIDYLQLINNPDARRFTKREEFLSSVSRACKLMAAELGITTVLLSQLNRASAKEQRLPRMDDLRESGSIEQDADEVLLIHRALIEPEDGADPESYADRERMESDGLLLVEKVRNGKTGVIPIRFDGELVTFHETKNGQVI